MSGKRLSELYYFETGPNLVLRLLGFRPSVFHSPRKGKIMKRSTEHKIEGAAHQVKGAIKQTVGRAIGDRVLQGEGREEKHAGKDERKAASLKKR